MTDEMKLLRAFIEASGFDVEMTIDRTETPISKQSGENRIAACSMTTSHGDLVVERGEFKRGEDGCYFLMPSLNVDYELTKKPSKPSSYIKCNKCGTHLAHNSPLGACLCGNSHNLERDDR